MTTTGDAPEPSGPHVVRATYPDMQRARRAIGALEGAGVPGSDIRLFGERAEEAQRATDTAPRDRRLASTALRAIGAGLALGAVAGAGLATLLAWLAYGLAGLAKTGAAAAGGAGGGFLGFMLGAMIGIKQSEAWELTYEPVGLGLVGVEVRTADEVVAGLAADKLAEHGRLEQAAPDDDQSARTRIHRGGVG